MADKYYRLVKFVVDICPQPQRKLFSTCASFSQGLPLDFDKYLGTRQRDIDSLLNRNIIRQHQYDMIFPTSGTVDLDNWDLTLVALLLKELFRVQLNQMFPGQSKKILEKVDDIRSVRNTLQHKSNTAKVSEQEFDALWNILEDATLFIAQNALGNNNVNGKQFENQMKILIDEAKLNNMPDLGDYLRQWFSEMYIQMKNELQLKIENLQDELKKIGKDTKDSRDMILSASKKRKGRSGAPIKHMRTLDPRIERMKDRLAASMRDHFPVEQGHLEEDISKIIYHLRQYHRVVIISCDTKRSFQSVLAAIKRMEYQQENCLEVTDPLDWKVISSEDAEIVVFRDPFGQDMYDEPKARATVGEIDGIIECSKADNDTERIDIVIISEKSAFDECQQSFGLELPENPLVHISHTTQMTPIDLTKERSIDSRHDNTDPVYKNIAEMSCCYIRQKKIPFSDQMLLKKAKECFKMHKILVLCGGRRTGKTSLVVELLSDYREDSRLILTEPGELKHVNLSNSCVVVIEDIGGKQQLEMAEANKWFRKFELIHSAVKEGKLNVIVTVETDVFNTWIQKIPDHPLFQENHVIMMPEKPLIIVKQEQSIEKGLEMYAELHMEYGWVVRVTPFGRISRYLCKDLLRPRQAAKYPFKPIDTRAITIACRARLAERGGYFNVSEYTSERRRKHEVENRNSVKRIQGHERYKPFVKQTHSEPKWEVGNVKTYNVKLQSDQAETNIPDMCVLQSGEVLLIDQLNKRIKKVNHSYEVSSVHDLPDYPVGICSARSNEAIAILAIGKLYYVNVSDGISNLKSVDLEHSCSHGAFKNNCLYIIEPKSIYRYNVLGKEKRVLYKAVSESEEFWRIAMNISGSMIYTSGRSFVRTFDVKGNRLCSLSIHPTPSIVIRTSLFIDKLANLFLFMTHADGERLIQINTDGKSIIGDIALPQGFTQQRFCSACLDTGKSVLLIADSRLHVAQWHEIQG